MIKQVSTTVCIIQDRQANGKYYKLPSTSTSSLLTNFLDFRENFFETQIFINIKSIFQHLIFSNVLYNISYNILNVFEI